MTQETESVTWFRDSNGKLISETNHKCAPSNMPGGNYICKCGVSLPAFDELMSNRGLASEESNMGLGPKKK